MRQRLSSEGAAGAVCAAVRGSDCGGAGIGSGVLAFLYLRFQPGKPKIKSFTTFDRDGKSFDSRIEIFDG